MDELSMIIVLCCVAFFNFVAICVFAYYSKKRKNINYIIISSGLYSLALFIFYFDVASMLDEHYTFYIPFITFILILSSLNLFLSAIRELNKIKCKLTVFHQISYSIILSSLLGYTTMMGEIYYRAIVFYIGISIPLLIALWYYYKSKVGSLLNLITLQIFLILLLILANIIHFFLYKGEVVFTNPPNFVIAYLMLINILVVTSIFSYIVELTKFDLEELEEKSILLESMFKTVKKSSETDELTEAFNRRKINQIMDVLMINYIKTKTPFSVLLLDIDKFKLINDTYGHLIGDEVLKFATKVLGSVTRNSDFIGRWGGDEFIILLSNTTNDNCEKVARNIKVKDKTYTKGNISISIDFSIGCMQAQVNMSSEELIHKADMKLYDEKNKKVLAE